MLVNTSNDFMRAVREAAESRQDALARLMVEEFFERSSVEISGEVDWISITKSTPRHLARVSGDFVYRYCAGPDDLLFLLLHEMAHRFDLDFEDTEPAGCWRGPDPAAFDDGRRSVECLEWLSAEISINSRLCAAWFPRAAPLFLKVFDPRRFPDVLMIPPVCNVPLVFGQTTPLIFRVLF